MGQAEKCQLGTRRSVSGNGDTRKLSCDHSVNFTVHLEDGRGSEWKLARIAAAKGGSEVLRNETLEISRGGRARLRATIGHRGS